METWFVLLGALVGVVAVLLVYWWLQGRMISQVARTQQLTVRLPRNPKMKLVMAESFTHALLVADANGWSKHDWRYVAEPPHMFDWRPQDVVIVEYETFAWRRDRQAEEIREMWRHLLLYGAEYRFVGKHGMKIDV